MVSNSPLPTEVEDSRLWGSHLELRLAVDGVCHVLDHLRLEPGDEIEMLLSTGQWLRGRYRWTGMPTSLPELHLEVVGHARHAGCGVLDAVLPIPIGATLRRI